MLKMVCMSAEADENTGNCQFKFVGGDAVTKTAFNPARLALCGAIGDFEVGVVYMIDIGPYVRPVVTTEES